MSTTNVQDFVIKRRRRTRHAVRVDPCPGFYSVPNSNPRTTRQIRDVHPSTSKANYAPEYSTGPISTPLPSQSLGPTAAPRGCEIMVKPQHSSEHRASIIPDREGEDAIIPSPIQSDIEDLLQRMAPKRLVKYGRRKRQAESPIKVSGDSGGSDELQVLLRPLKRRRSESTIDRSCSLSLLGLPFPSTSKKHKPKPQVKYKKGKSLAERLIKASILSHGNPAECLFNPNLLTPAFRLCPPINFVPDMQNSKPPPRLAWTLVDPKKAAPFRLASFQAQAKREPSVVNTSKHKPLNRWMHMGTSNSLKEQLSHKIPKIKGQNGVETTRLTADHFSQCRPLAFISLKDAEANYSQSKRNKDAGVSRVGQPTRTCKLHEQHSGIKRPSPLLFVSRQPFQPGTSSSSDTVQRSDILETSPLPIQHNGSLSKDAELVQDPSLETSETNVHMPYSTPEDDETLSLIHMGSHLKAHRHDTSSPSAQPSATLPQTTTKTLRPLGAFFDCFRERGRNVTMGDVRDFGEDRGLLDSDISSSHRKKTTSISEGDVMGSLRSFIQTSLRSDISMMHLPFFTSTPDASTIRPLTLGRKQRPSRRLSQKTGTPIQVQVSYPSALDRIQMTPCSKLAIATEPLLSRREDEMADVKPCITKVLSVLQPQPYQIIICSPPSASVFLQPQSSFSHHSSSPDIGMINFLPTGIFDNLDI